MVFDPAAAPRDATLFGAWYEQQVRWGESHGYNNPDIPAPALRAWFMEMIEVFPPMNGPLAGRAAGDHTFEADYALGRACIYAAFAWSKSAQALARVTELAAKHAVGFFAASDRRPHAWFPEGAGKWVKVRIR